MGQLITALTFAGVIVHELSHELFCRLLGVRVEKVCYFRFGNPAGYVVHEQAKYFFQAFLIATGPMILGTALAIFLFRADEIIQSSINEYVWIWLGFSVAINSLPSRGDAKSLWLENWSQIKRNILALCWLPVTLLVWLLSFLSSLWVSSFYALALFYLARYF